MSSCRTENGYNITSASTAYAPKTKLLRTMVSHIHIQQIQGSIKWPILWSTLISGLPIKKADGTGTIKVKGHVPPCPQKTPPRRRTLMLKKLWLKREYAVPPKFVLKKSAPSCKSLFICLTSNSWEFFWNIYIYIETEEWRVS